MLRRGHPSHRVICLAWCSVNTVAPRCAGEPSHHACRDLRARTCTCHTARTGTPTRRQTNDTATQTSTHARTRARLQLRTAALLYCGTCRDGSGSVGLGSRGPRHRRRPGHRRNATDTVAMQHGAGHRRGRRHPAQSLISPSLSEMSPPSASKNLTNSASMSQPLPAPSADARPALGLWGTASPLEHIRRVSNEAVPRAVAKAMGYELELNAPP